jgi:UrcA family protein
MNGRYLASLLIVPALALASLGAPTASAESGTIRVAWTQVIRYADFEPVNPQDRLALLAQVEAAAADYCDRPMTRADRRACARTAVDKALRDAPAAIGAALAAARTERDGVKQAMR